MNLTFLAKESKAEGPTSSPRNPRGKPIFSGAGPTSPSSPSPDVPVPQVAAAQPHGRALGRAHRHPPAGLDRVDPELRHGAHLLQPPAPPGPRAAPGHGPQRHGGQSQRGHPQPAGPGRRGEAEAGQSRGAGGAHDRASAGEAGAPGDPAPRRALPLARSPQGRRLLTPSGPVKGRRVRLLRGGPWGSGGGRWRLSFNAIFVPLPPPLPPPAAARRGTHPHDRCK